MNLRSAIAIVTLAALVALAPTPSALAQAPIGGRPAELRTGTCVSLGEVVMKLANVILTPGDPVGQVGATPVEQSGTVVPYTVSDLLASDHIVVVHASPTADAAPVACGEIGGALNPDGTLAIGMGSMNGSSVSGVAYFTPIETFQNTLVTILLVDSDAEPAVISVEAADGVTGSSGAADVSDTPEEPGQPS
jgi:hypothetical protein